MSRFENRRWLVIPTSVTSSINFNEVQEPNSGSLRLSLDGSKTFVKYEITEVTSSYDVIGIDPDTENEITESIQAGVYGRPSFYSSSYDEYTHSEILNLLNTDAWNDPEANN